jgi:uncharacterized protein YqjF (DUF2071 family)
MDRSLYMRGADVLFAHWPVDPSRLQEFIPAPLEVDVYDNRGWVSVLAFEVEEARPTALPFSPTGRFVQLNFRTYVTLDGDSGVYFISSDTSDGFGAVVGRPLLKLPFTRAEMRLNRTDTDIIFRSRRPGSTPEARFDARYRPVGTPGRAEPGSLAAFAIERHTYFVPVDGGESVYVGEIEREPWELQSVEASIRTNTLFEAAGLERPSATPEVAYSPSFETKSTAPSRVDLVR